MPASPNTDRSSGRAPSDERPSFAKPLLLAAVLLAVPLAGCAESDPADGGAGTLEGDAMTGEDGLAAADEEAQAWAEDPTLVEIATFETAQEGGPENSATAWSEWPADGNVGDGLAYGWKYTYMNQAGDKVNVIVTVDGETGTNEDVQTQSDQELSSWEINSPEALDAARENDTFDAILDEDDANVLVALADGGQDDPGWLIRAQSDAAGQQQTMLVNANTGESQPFAA